MTPQLLLHGRFLWLTVIAVWLAACATPPSSLTPEECLAIAESYRTHRWKAEARHVRHGRDAQGIRVDTPDISYRPSKGLGGWWRPGEINEGIPYQWGGFDTLAQFDAKLRAGAAAGDVYTPEKRQLLEAGVSRDAAGVDCSGFVSRCWKLPTACSTRTLPSLCNLVPSWADAQPGDIFNTHNAHVMLFAGWADPKHERAIVYETGRPPAWKVVRHEVETAWLRRQGYQLWRYRGMKLKQP